MDAFLLGVATNLASDLVKAGARRIRDAALGDAQLRALEAVFGRALAHLLAELSGADRLGGERELLGLIEEQLGSFFANPEVADDLVDAALAAEPVPIGRLRKRFEEMGFDPDTFLASFERSMSVLSQRLAKLMREEASEPNSPLHNLVEISKLYALEEEQKELLRRAGPAGPTADELERESWARCKRRWVLLGVPPEEADTLARNPTVGAPGRKVREKLKQPIVVIIAEVGSGKSLLLDRLMQRAILRYRDQEGAPLPVFINATEVEGKLREAVAKGTSALGDIAERGAAVFLDGLEEAGRARARQLLSEAHYLPDQLPATTVVVAGRPIRELDEERERGQAFVLPRLSEEESLDLVRRFAGEVQGVIGHRWPASLAEATKRPLFATLVGLDMRERRYGWDARSEGELLAHLMDRALNDAEDTADLRELRDLAVAIIESGTGYVRASDVGTGAEVLRLRRTGFVYQQGGILRFSLQILTEWFAAQALELGEMDAEELASDFARLERWRYPLVMAVSDFGYERMLRIFAPVVRAAPAFASQVADAAFGRYGGAAEDAVETVEEVTARLRETMGAWVEGLGSLAPLFAPVRQDGSVGTLAITGWEPWEPGKGNYAWYAGEVDLPDVVPFSRVVESELCYGIPQRTYIVGRQAAWPWKITFKDLRGELEKALKGQVLPALTPMLAREAAWRTAKELLYREKRRPRSIDRPIVLDEIEQCLDAFGVWDGEWIWKPPPRASLRPVLFGARHLVEEVRWLRDSGAAHMTSPVPAADLTVEEARERIGSGGTMFTWTLYSDEHLLKRARLLVEEALRAYAKILETLLLTLRSHVPMAATLPGKVTGYLEGLGNDTGYSGPRVRWYMEPLPAGSENVCELSLETRPDEVRPELWEEYDEHAYRARPKIACLRPQAAGWLTPQTGALISGQLFDSTPVTKTVYMWLWDDLRYAKWTDRTNPWRM